MYKAFYGTYKNIKKKNKKQLYIYKTLLDASLWKLIVGISVVPHGVVSIQCLWN